MLPQTQQKYAETVLNRKQALENEPEEIKRKFTRSKGDTSNDC